MRAIQFTTYGGPEVLAWGDAPDRHAGPGQIRVAVRAASVNPIDWKIFSGALAGGQPLEGTGYLGFDAAGVVDEVGEGVSDVSVGDDVSVFCRLEHQGTTSVKVHVECWAKERITGDAHKVTEGLFTYVAIGEDGKPQPIDG